MDYELKLHLGGILLTRAMAGPNPFHNAVTPSTAIVFRAQSRNPEYVPVGADCIRDLSTYQRMSAILCCQELCFKRTSGGMAIDHIATPADPPAIMIAPRFRSDGEAPAGVKSFLTTSYAAKYL